MIKISELNHTKKTMNEKIQKKLDKKIRRADKTMKSTAEVKFSHRIPPILVKKILEEYEKEGFDVTTWYEINFLHNGLNMLVLIEWR